VESLADYVISEPVVDQEQLELEAWFQKRSGKFTCSRFGDLMVSGRGKDEIFGQTAMSYIYQVAAERLGSYVFPFDNSTVRWGKENERTALVEYCDRVGIEVDECKTGTDAFIEFNPFVGGTPDAICLPGCVEIKCPYTPQEHLRTVHENTVPKQYVWQVQGHLLLTGADYCDFVSFDPRIINEQFRLHVIRVRRDQMLLDTLATRLAAAVEIVKQICAEK
jgi:hypothetical protein